MTGEQCRLLVFWFKSHVRTFRESDPVHQRSLDLKEEHTEQVCAIMNRITSGLGLPDNARRIAQVIALFHDLGRFVQYRQYRTFRDQDSENHAKLSLRELNRYRVLHGLDTDERQMISRAIFFHNRLRLPAQLDPDTFFFSRLIRDADKIDIMRVMAEHFRTPAAERNQVVTLGLAQDGEVRSAVFQQLFAGRIMSYTELENINEFKVLLLSWVFDLNFAPSFEILKERKDIATITATMPDSQLLREALDFIGDYIERRLRGEAEEGH